MITYLAAVNINSTSILSMQPIIDRLPIVGLRRTLLHQLGLRDLSLWERIKRQSFGYHFEFNVCWSHMWLAWGILDKRAQTQKES